MVPIFSTQSEYDARCSNSCPNCNQAKEQGSLVCWDCFKRIENPLKYFAGTFEKWLEIERKKREVVS